MVQGLLIRQIFLLLDVLLALGIVAAAPFIVMAAIGRGPDVSSFITPQAQAAQEDAALNTLSRAGAHASYKPILDNGLFGDAGRFKKEAPPAPEPAPVQEEVEETSLNLTLMGTTVSGQFSSAIIQDGTNSTIDTVFLDWYVVDDVQLKEVRQREIIILNKRKNPHKTEKLSMDDQKENPAPAPSTQVARRPTVSTPSVQNEVVTVKRNEMIQELYASYADLVTNVKPEVVTDNNGKVIGYTAQNISQIPIATKLGLADGDVLQSVNNERIDSEQKIMQLVQKYRNAGSIRIGILRNNKPQFITYNLK